MRGWFPENPLSEQEESHSVNYNWWCLVEEDEGEPHLHEKYSRRNTSSCKGTRGCSYPLNLRPEGNEESDEENEEQEPSNVSEHKMRTATLQSKELGERMKIDRFMDRQTKRQAESCTTLWQNQI